MVGFLQIHCGLFIISFWMKIYEYILKIKNHMLLFEFCYDWLKTYDL